MIEHIVGKNKVVTEVFNTWAFGNDITLVQTVYSNGETFPSYIDLSLSEAKQLLIILQDKVNEVSKQMDEYLESETNNAKKV